MTETSRPSEEFYDYAKELLDRTFDDEDPQLFAHAAQEIKAHNEDWYDGSEENLNGNVFYAAARMGKLSLTRDDVADVVGGSIRMMSTYWEEMLHIAVRKDDVLKEEEVDFDEF